MTNGKNIDELLSLVGTIPDEYVERQKYIICELIMDNTGIMHRTYESLTKMPSKNKEK